MNKLIILLAFISNLSFAQTDTEFMNDFLLEDELNVSNEIEQYNQFNFAEIWTKTDNNLIYGIIGVDHQRIKIKLLSIEKSSDNPNEYLVTGKSNVKDNICDFSGVIQIDEIKTVKELHYGVDEEYKNKGIKAQGILITSYNFEESEEQVHSGFFAGKLYSKWYLDAKNKMQYDDIQLISDGYLNNAFIGTWESYKTGKDKICNWADYRVPNANKDFDIGVGEFNVAEKYWNKGWVDIALKHQVPNGAIKKVKTKRNVKLWWE
ncbi:hypothetical protein [Chondrinema litorale]|uniref:hypothetical protein n=1 Tax=Chondrinema litorale TaxID=2994555 RepID=UPI0025427645|nr:hypothetical protein [Chondrinema litorale]UZR92913.1 hypothetical protein OQ292_13710 [Chondrinema litorale]